MSLCHTPVPPGLLSMGQLSNRWALRRHRPHWVLLWLNVPDHDKPHWSMVARGPALRDVRLTCATDSADTLHEGRKPKKGAPDGCRLRSSRAEPAMHLRIVFPS